MAKASIGNVDVCGGTIRPGTQTKFSFQGNLIAVVGDAIDSHGTGGHAAATMSSGSAKLTVQGFAVCRFGDSATCGHTVSTSTSTLEVTS